MAYGPGVRDQDTPDESATRWEPLSSAERAVDGFLRDSHLAPPHAMPALVAEHARGLGARDAVLYLVDLQGNTLVPFLGSSGPDHDSAPQVLPIDTTLAGLAFQRSDVLSQRGHGDAEDESGDDAPPGEHAVRLWIP